MSQFRILSTRYAYPLLHEDFRVLDSREDFTNPNRPKMLLMHKLAVIKGVSNVVYSSMTNDCVYLDIAGDSDTEHVRENIGFIIDDHIKELKG